MRDFCQACILIYRVLLTPLSYHDLYYLLSFLWLSFLLTVFLIYGLVGVDQLGLKWERCRAQWPNSAVSRRIGSPQSSQPREEPLNVIKTMTHALTTELLYRSTCVTHKSPAVLLIHNEQVPIFCVLTSSFYLSSPLNLPYFLYFNCTFLNSQGSYSRRAFFSLALPRAP
jgi:hypothetical protein